MQISLYNYLPYKKTVSEKKIPAQCRSEIPSCKQSLLTQNNLRANYMISFKSLKATSEREYMHLGTSFYRDFDTLAKASLYLKEKFPEGTDIMEFAASNGEEAISLHSLINDRNNVKYKIHCYDVSDKAIKLANLNIHSIFKNTSDEFLISKENRSLPLNEMARTFHELMEEIPESDVEINDKDYMDFLRSRDKDFYVKYYKVRDEYKDNFKFEKGDIRNILEIMPEKKVGAVFFRNAFYHLTNNHIFEPIYDKPTLDKIWFTNKEAVIEDVVSKVYEKLLPGGIFVIGNDEKEHIYQADKYTPREDYYFDDSTDEYIRISSPLEKALRKGGRFRPVAASRCYSSHMGDFEVHTVWQKVDNTKLKRDN